MLLLCSATTNGSSHSKVSVCGGFKYFTPHQMTFVANCSNVDKVVLNFSNSVRLDVGPVRIKPLSCLCLTNIGNSKQFVSRGMNAQSLYQNGLPNLRQCALSNAVDSTISHPVSDSVKSDANSISFIETKISPIVSKLSESAADTLHKGESVLNKVSDSVTLSLTTALKNTNQAVGNSLNEIVSFINKSAGSKLGGLTSELKEVPNRAVPFALDVLRGTIVVVESSLVKGGETVGYAYSYVKESLPPGVQGALGSSEERVGKVLIPAGTAFQQVYMAVEGFEESLGLDPNDPLVPFLLFLGLSVTLWGSYRLVKYRGYAGDLSPQSTLKLLQGNENAVLVDIRPENIKERDGVPDLRRAARFRYASVTLPEVDGSVKKLLKGGRDIEYTLLAAVILNLKTVDDRSKILVMDADGTYSKGVARSLRKLGTKKPYLVKGGFRSWVKDGLRVKMVKPETALTIINEEAEAILEEIKPTPLKTIGYGVAFAAATYSIVEWERTLQFIGVLGVAQSLFRRVASYEDVEDLKQDLRLLVTPVRVGGQAISWASGKLGRSNGNGLPTSPSSSEVQSRVLQAAAKHESQLSDDEDSSEIESPSDKNTNT